jgi:hypothetical protein
MKADTPSTASPGEPNLSVGPFACGSLAVGLLGSAACAAGAYFDPAAFYPAYLVGVLFWLGISLGCLAIAMLHHLTGGGWGLAIRRVLEAAYGVLPLLGLLFLPILLGLRTLYVWARPEAVALDELLQRKVRYLNVEAFEIRAAAYFAVWIMLGLTLNWLSAGANSTNEPLRRQRLALVSGPGLVLWALTVTFASIDWAMSLEPDWYSSAYGVLFMAGQGVSGLAFALVAVMLHRDRSPWTNWLTTSRLHDLGNLLLAFVLFWSYVSFMQYLIVWSGNLPEETPWYLNRSRGGWQFVALGLIGMHFVVPFLLLLARQNKRDPRRLLGIAVLLLTMRLVDLSWLVMPAFSPGRFTLHWLDFAAPLTIGGFWLALFSWRLKARAARPIYDVPEHSEAPHDALQSTAH